MHYVAHGECPDMNGVVITLACVAFLLACSTFSFAACPSSGARRRRATADAGVQTEPALIILVVQPGDDVGLADRSGDN